MEEEEEEEEEEEDKEECKGVVLIPSSYNIDIEPFDLVS